MFFTENKTITVHCWDLQTLEHIGSQSYDAQEGLGLPSGMTEDAPDTPDGYVAIRDSELNKWKYVKDDRGRVFYDKSNGEEYKTETLGEIVDRHKFTAISPPQLNINEITRFETEKQSWIVGLDWYEKPVWDENQKMSYCSDVFFIPNGEKTNIEPTAEQANFILDDYGNWIKPPVEDKSEEEKSSTEK